MNLSAYLKPLSEVQRRDFAQRCGTTWNHMRNVAYSGKPCGVLLAVNVERETKLQVRRQDLRPADWRLIWPELEEVAVSAEEARDAA